MDNHYHLVVKTGSNPDPTLSLFMQTLNSVFAKNYNKMNNTFGTVFAKRFSSIIVQQGDNLKEIIRHVHLNPVRSGDCTLENLDSYKWCGHAEIVNDKTDSIIDRTDALNFFSGSDQLTEYNAYIGTPCKETPESVKHMKASNKGSFSFHKSNCFVIGDEEFAKEVFKQDLIRKARIALYVRNNLTLEKVADKISVGIQFTAESIRMHGRLNEQSTFRQLFALYAHCYYDFRCTQIAQFLNVTPSAVSMMISRCNRITDLNIIKEFIGC
jgi:predicted DNA-binding protein YlxM (UPF0122 family)